MSTPTQPLSDDVLIHFLGPLTVPMDSHTSLITRYGDEWLATPERWSMTLDRNGASWLDLLDDGEGQVRRFKQVFFRRGPWPEGQPRLQPGSDEWAEARENARSAAHQHQLPEERQRALAQLHIDFGPAPVTSKTVREERATFE